MRPQSDDVPRDGSAPERVWHSHVSWVYDTPPAAPSPYATPAPAGRLPARPPPPIRMPHRPGITPDLLGLALSALFGGVLAVVVGVTLGLLYAL